MRKWLVWLALGLAVAVHGVQLTGPIWAKVRDAGHARDFASYHYAVAAAAGGEDPYDAAVLGRLAREEGTRRSVHPFFYPPPYLLTVAWTLPLELSTAYRTWYVLDSLFLLAVLLALMRWLPARPMVGFAALVLVTYSPIPDNHWMGQANLPVLALVCWAFWHEQRGRLRLAGALMGLAAMMKMSPGLLVLWWFTRRRTWPAAVSACVTAVLLSLATLPLLGFTKQLRFYTEILPGFASGDYNGLRVSVALPGNHSIANLWAQVYPAGRELHPTARGLSSLTTGLLVGVSLLVLVLRARRRPFDALDHACAAGALVAWMVIVPVYAYEHHLVLLLLPLAAAAQALSSRRLHPAWSLAVVPAYAALAWPLGAVRAASSEVGGVLGWGVQEAKCFAILVIGLACLAAGRGRRGSRQAVLVPAPVEVTAACGSPGTSSEMRKMEPFGAK